MKIRCPVCHAESELAAVCEQDAARDLLALLVLLPVDLARPLTAYLGLFRSRKRALGWERGLRLTRQTLSLCADYTRLATALSLTVEALRAKRESTAATPLGNHNYLKRVLEGVREDTLAATVSGPAKRPVRPLTATEEAVLAIRGVRFDDLEEGGP